MTQGVRLHTYCASTVPVPGLSSWSSAIHGEHSVHKLSAFDFTVESLPLRLRDEELEAQPLAGGHAAPCGKRWQSTAPSNKRGAHHH